MSANFDLILPCHGMLLECVVKYKKIFTTYETTFSCLLDEGISKICKKFNFHDGFLRTDQDRAKNAAGWDGLAVLSCMYLK